MNRQLKAEALLLQQELAADGLDIELIKLNDPFSGMGELRLAFSRTSDAFTFLTLDITLDRVREDKPEFTYTVYTNYSGYQGYTSRGKVMAYVQAQLKVGKLTLKLEDVYQDEL